MSVSEAFRERFFVEYNNYGRGNCFHRARNYHTIIV